MKPKFYTQLLTLLAGFMMLAGAANAQQYDFKSGQLYYKITDAAAKTVSVVSENSSNPRYSNNAFPAGAVVIPAAVTYNGAQYTVTAIADYVFDDCTSLTSLTIPETVLFLANYTLAQRSSALTQFIVNTNNPKFLSENGVIFSKDKKILVAMPAGKTGDYVVPSSVTEIRSYACDDAQISSIKFNSNLKSIGYMSFGGCEKLKSLNLPSNLTTIGDHAFTLCTSLTSVSIPNSVKTIGASAFSQCHALPSIIIPNSISTIERGTFYDCINLTSVTIPNSVTTIGEHAFQACLNLTSITIPNAVTTIGKRAFCSCNKLSTIYCQVPSPASITTFGEEVFLDVPKNTCTLYVPIGSKNKYAAANQWKDFKNIIERKFDTGLPSLASQGLQVHGGKRVIEINAQPPIGGAIEHIASIYNMSGALVRSVALSGGQTFLSVDIPAGIYIVKISNAAEKVVVR